MSRPSQPLISRAAVVEGSLHIIDTEGLEALSLPRIARHLNVSAPSLYHHFEDKSEILGAVAREIVRGTVIPRRRADTDWREWFVALSVNFRRAVLKHRNAAPLLLRHMPRNVLTDVYEGAAAFLAEAGVPIELHVQLLDGLETLSLGSSMTEAARPPATRNTIFPNVDPLAHPYLTAALERNEYSARMLFEELVRSYIRGVVDANPSVIRC